MENKEIKDKYVGSCEFCEKTIFESQLDHKEHQENNRFLHIGCIKGLRRREKEEERGVILRKKRYISGVTWNYRTDPDCVERCNSAYFGKKAAEGLKVIGIEYDEFSEGCKESICIYYENGNMTRVYNINEVFYKPGE